MSIKTEVINPDFTDDFRIFERIAKTIVTAKKVYKKGSTKSWICIHL